MALSEEERRRLEMLELELASSDPGLYRRLQAGTPGTQGREAGSMVRGSLTMLGAFALMIVGIASGIIIVGVAGFVLMMAGAHWFLNGFLPPGGQHYPPGKDPNV